MLDQGVGSLSAGARMEVISLPVPSGLSCTVFSALLGC